MRTRIAGAVAGAAAALASAAVAAYPALFRNRIKTPGASAPGRLAYTVVMEPGSLVMERKMLLGIKQRVERLAAALTQA